eukprot:6414355-Prorocentrum_lima.AAC.1
MTVSEWSLAAWPEGIAKAKLPQNCKNGLRPLAKQRTPSHQHKQARGSALTTAHSSSRRDYATMPTVTHLRAPSTLPNHEISSTVADSYNGGRRS